MNNEDIPVPKTDTTEARPSEEMPKKRFTVAVVWKDLAHQCKMVKDCMSITPQGEDIILKDASGNRYVLLRSEILYYTCSAPKEPPPKLADTVARLNSTEGLLGELDNAAEGWKPEDSKEKP